MDFRLESFLRLIQDIIKTKGLEYKDNEYKFRIHKNGQMAIRYAPLMKRHEALRIFLQTKNRDSKWQAILVRCKITSDGKGSSRDLHFVEETVQLIETVLKKDSYSDDEPLLDTFCNSPTTTEDNGIEQESSPQQVACNTLNQRTDKTHYHPKYVQQFYKESGLQDIEELINNRLRTSGWNQEMKQKCLEKLIKNIQREHNMHIIEEEYTNSVLVCSSIKKFMLGLDKS